MSDPFDKLRNFDANVESPDPKLIRDRARQIKVRRYQAVGAMGAILVVVTSALLFRPTTSTKIASPRQAATPSASPRAESGLQGAQAPVPGEPGGTEATGPAAAAAESRAGARSSSQAATAKVRVELELSGETASAGNPVTFRLSVCNDQSSSVTLNFNSSQRFDIEVLRGDGSVVWRWGADKQFAQVTGSETFPAGCRLIGEERWDGTAQGGEPLPPGDYLSRGRLTSNPAFDSGTRKVCVVACS